ncbi:RHS repeat-associated core domain-containing protein [Tenacibaculum finnmarkense]
MLQTVTRPDGIKVHFTYDALGRRLTKKFKNTTTRWLWDGNVPLHEWKENSNGVILSNSTVADNGIITWVFEENSFIPTAKLRGDKKYSILADHLGTPTSMHNEEGETTWERSLDSNGKVKTGDNSSCPFLFQGQYYDAEIELAYNRFRYYDPEDGRYISVDPIGLLSGEPNLYSYVDNTNAEIDVFGLDTSTDAVLLRNDMIDKGMKAPLSDNSAHHMVSSNDNRDGMEAARNHMESLDVSINSHHNGVFLATNLSTDISNSPELSKAHRHSIVHNTNSRTYISSEILKAKTKEDVIITLNKIRNMHLKGDIALLSNRRKNSYSK